MRIKVLKRLKSIGYKKQKQYINKIFKMEIYLIKAEVSPFCFLQLKIAISDLMLEILDECIRSKLFMILAMPILCLTCLGLLADMYIFEEEW